MFRRVCTVALVVMVLVAFSGEQVQGAATAASKPFGTLRGVSASSARKATAKKVIKKAVYKLAKKPLGPVVEVASFVKDWCEVGFRHAVNEATWPLSELWRNDE